MSRITGGYTRAPNDLLEDNTISTQARFLYIILLKYAWKKNEAYPGQKTLAHILSVDDRTIRTYLKELEEHGLIKTHRQGLTKNNRYTLLKWISPTYDRKNNPFQNGNNHPPQNGNQLPTNNTKNKKTKSEKGNTHSPLTYEEIMNICKPHLREVSLDTGVDEGSVRDVLRKMASHYESTGESFESWVAKLRFWVMKDIEQERVEKSPAVIQEAHDEIKRKKIEKTVISVFGDNWQGINGLFDMVTDFLSSNGRLDTPLEELQAYLSYLKESKEGASDSVKEA